MSPVMARWPLRIPVTRSVGIARVNCKACHVFLLVRVHDLNDGRTDRTVRPLEADPPLVNIMSYVKRNARTLVSQSEANRHHCGT